MNLPSTPIQYVLQYKLWSKVKIVGENPDNNFYTNCWEYQGNKTEFGHGCFSHRRRGYFAHRVAYCLAHGIDPSTFPSETVVRHDCDNPSCCNPLHLRTGSQVDNQLDMEVRGRNPKGESHGMASIDIKQVMTIRYLHKTAEGVVGTGLAISKRLGVSQRVVSSVITGECWSSVPDDFSLLIPLPDSLSDSELRVERENNRGGSELTHLDIQKMRALWECGETLKEIGAKFNNMVESGVSNIVNKKNWIDVPYAAPEQVLTPEEIALAKSRKENKGEDHHSAALTAAQVREIRWLFTIQGEKHGFITKVGERYGVSKQVARAVLVRQTYGTVADDFDLLEPKPALIDFGFSGEHGLSTLTAQQVREIRWLGSQHAFRGVATRLSEHYKVTKENVRSILSRKTWTNLPDDFDTLVKPEPLEANVKASVNAKLTPHQVLEIKYLWDTSDQGKGIQTRIAKQYGMDVQAIRQIVHGKTWTHIEKNYDRLDPKPTLAP